MEFDLEALQKFVVVQENGDYTLNVTFVYENFDLSIDMKDEDLSSHKIYLANFTKAQKFGDDVDITWGISFGNWFKGSIKIKN